MKFHAFIKNAQFSHFLCVCSSTVATLYMKLLYLLQVYIAIKIIHYCSCILYFVENAEIDYKRIIK